MKSQSTSTNCQSSLTFSIFFLKARSANDMDEVQTGIKQVKGEKAVEHRRKAMRELVLIFDQLVVGKQCAEEQR